MFYGNPCGPCANCVTPPIVHPPKYCQVNTFSSTLVPHIHPTHTNVVNHHVLKHTHLFPQSTSVANSVNNVDIGPSAGIAPAYGGYGMGGYGMGGYGMGGYGMPASYGAMVPSMPVSTGGAFQGSYTGKAAMMPTPYPTQVAPVPGVKEMPMYPGMKKKY